MPPDYRRLVSYMYNYEEGIKKNNVGYARVEARNGQCKCTIHVTTPSLNGRELKVYMFKREGKELEGVLLGNIPVRNGVGEFRITTDPLRLMNTSYAITDISGIVLLHTEQKFLATIWDEEPFNQEMVYSISRGTKRQVKEEESVEAAEIHEENKQTESVKEEIPEESIIETAKAKDSLIAEDTKVSEEKKISIAAEDKATEVKAEELEKKDEASDTISAEAETEKEVIPVESLALNSVKEKNIAALENTSGGRKIHIDKKYIDKGITIPSNSTQEAEEEINSSGLRECPTNQETILEEAFEEGDVEGEVAYRFLNEYVRVDPFEDGEILWCVKIEPKDLSLLPVDYLSLANNSFLLHGFYGHKHLIFARVNSSSKSYILGVPGVYHNRERFMARMFGFENFKCTKRRDRRMGEFGYWYIPIQLQ